ncbi:hypothetical protein HAD_03195 [Hyphomonas adhaerens MHS-3]|uniref:Uncharacterized protein n=1 Tax=Hyphomonas adhaerens MHS-3 TaxID=1280949 RepID=A0A069E3V2_9PROT|nr:hypothetical protein HAD_03195 [Hyphomonas adhaerens MHS-3]
MRLHICIPIDFGVVFGIADEVLADEVRRILTIALSRTFANSVSDFPVSDPAQLSYVSGVDNPFGRGLHFAGMEKCLWERLSADILEYCTLDADKQLFDPVGPDVSVWITENFSPEIAIRFYANGVVMVLIDGEISDDTDADLIKRVYRAIECAAYGDSAIVELAAAFNNTLRNLRDEISRHAKKLKIHDLERANAIHASNELIEIKWISALLIIDKTMVDEQFDNVITDTAGQKVETWSGQVIYKPWLAVVRRSGDRPQFPDRILSIFHNYCVADTFATNVETFLIGKCSTVLNETLRGKRSGKIVSRQSIRALSYLAESVSSLVDIRSFTHAADDRQFLSLLAERSRIDERQARIKSIANVFVARESDLNDFKDQQRAGWFAAIGLFIAVISTLGVSAGVVDVYRNYNFFSSSGGDELFVLGASEITLILALPLLLVLLLWLIGWLAIKFVRSLWKPR